jgi:hypothetical protein
MTQENTPITLFPRPESIVPLKYVIMIKTFECLECQSSTEISEAYAYDIFPSRLGFKQGAHLTPVSRFAYRLPIEIKRLAAQHVPCCQMCVDRLIASGGPSGLPDGVTLRAEQQWQLTLQRKAAEEAAKSGGAGVASRRKKSIQDLLDLI